MGKIITNKDYNSLVDIEKDILAHPEEDIDYLSSLFSRSEFTDSDVVALKSAYNKIVNNPNLSENQKYDLASNSWKINFKQRPPTPSEFLTESWLGITGEEMYDYKKRWFTEVFDPVLNPETVILYLPVGVGKSSFSVSSLLYISTHFYLMRDPYKYFNIQNRSPVSIVAISFTMDKAKELILAPLQDILIGNERFVRVKTAEQVERNMKDGDPNKIYWSTSTGTASAILRIGNLIFRQVASIEALLGLNVLSGVLSEIAYFRQRGFSDEKTMQLLTDLKERIQSRFGDTGMYYNKVFVDSSPNSLEYQIDQYICEDAPKDPSNYILTGRKWDFQPWLFPMWNKTKETFPIYTGTASSPPKILNEHERTDYDESLVVDTPIDLKHRSQENLVRVIQNFLGLPSGAADKLIQNHETIENIFQENLTNIYTYIHAPASLPPEGLIWEKVKDKFFIKVKDSYQFYRHPSAKRYISVDQSEVNDWTGIAMSHVEINTKGELVFVTDFAITIIPGPKKERINLEAIKFFIRDLRKLGGIDIGKVSFDQFQSSSTIQFLDRIGIDIEKLSVDGSTEPYLEYIAKMQRGTVKMGKSLIMKNNLKSLIMGETKIAKKKKVDHVLGDMEITNNKDWETSKLGYFGKDLSDAVVASVYLADKNGSKSPQIIWKDVGKTKEEVHDNMKSEMKSSIKEKMLGTSVSRFLK